MFHKAEQAVALARELNHVHAEIRAHDLCARNCDLSLRDAARAHARAVRELAERSRSWAEIRGGAEGECVVAVGAGDWKVAREAAARALELDSRSVIVLAAAAETEFQLGNLPQSVEHLTRLVDIGQSVRTVSDAGAFPLFATSAAMYCYVTGTAEYLAQVEQAGQMTLSNPRTPPTWVAVALSGLGIRAFLTRDEQAARDQLKKLDRFAGRWVFGLTVDHVRGLLFETLGQSEEALEAIETTLAYPQTGYGFRPLWSWAAYDCARIRLQRDAPGDRARARTLIDEALSHARKLGMRPLIDRLVALKLQDQGISTTGDIYRSIDAVADSVQREQPDITAHAAPDGTVTIMFSDIEDSTVLTERLGDQGWMELLRKHDALIRKELRAYDGFEVKTIGDAFMVAFQSAKKGLDCAIAIQRAFAADSQPGAAVPHERVKVRIGLHAGEAIKDGDDFYGKNVIMASRVAGKAVGGEILVSSLLRQLVESSVDAALFSEPREIELKGLAGTHTINAVRWQA
jgi:class 3 adenylate cyclase